MDTRTGKEIRFENALKKAYKLYEKGKIVKAINIQEKLLNEDSKLLDIILPTINYREDIKKAYDEDFMNTMKGVIYLRGAANQDDINRQMLKSTPELKETINDILEKRAKDFDKHPEYFKYLEITVDMPVNFDKKKYAVINKGFKKWKE